MDVGDNWGGRKFSGDASFSRPSKSNERFQFKSREQILWHFLDPYLIARLYGFTLQGLKGEEAKEMLRERKVWPYYYPDPQDPMDFDYFPTELAFDKTTYFRVSRENNGKKKKNSQRKRKKTKNSATDQEVKKNKKSKKNNKDPKHFKMKKNNAFVSFFKRLKLRK